MKRLFTISLLFLTVLSFGQAQLRVDAPAEVAGFYPIRITTSNDWGGNGFTYDLSGEIAMVDANVTDGMSTPNEGCATLKNDLTGKIAMVDRGNCQFGTKSLNAQNAGAIAVIICNNVDNAGAIGMLGGNDGPNVTIPVVSMGKEDCATIRVAIPNLVGSFLSQYDENEQIVWGETEGKFAGSIGNWTSVGVSGASVSAALWEYDANGSAAKGGFSSDTDAIVSPSSNDGAMVFNSDFLDNGGDSTKTNMGASPAPHSGELISPIMDLSSSGEVAVRFNQRYRNRNSTTAIAFSIDGGTTWSDPIPVNEEIGTEESTSSRSIKTIYLPGLGGSAQAQIKFIFNGSLYYWIIDDVKLIAAELYSSRISAFLFPPSNYGTPQSMIEGDSLFFSTLLTNDGIRDVNNIKLTGQVIGGESILYEDSAKLSMIETGRADTSLFINGGYEAPALDVGTYIARYQLTQDEAEYSPGNNVVNLPFEVTENTFQKDDGIIRGGIRSNTNTAYEYGNLFYVPYDGYQAVQASFAVSVNTGTTIGGEQYTIRLYKVVEDNDPSQFTDNDVELVGLASQTFPNDYANFSLITVDLVDFNSIEDGVVLEGDTEYLLMFTYAGAKEIFTANAEVSYGNRVVDVLKLDDGWFTGGFSGNVVPIVRMHIDQISSTKEPELASDKFKLYPNPAVDQIKVDLDLAGLSPNVEILIRDLSGRTLQQYNYENVQSDQFIINTDKLEGLYIMTIRTNEGVKSEKFMVFKYE